jgi:hypothetical protein
MGNDHSKLSIWIVNLCPLINCHQYIEWLKKHETARKGHRLLPKSKESNVF